MWQSIREKEYVLTVIFASLTKVRSCKTYFQASLTVAYRSILLLQNVEHTSSYSTWTGSQKTMGNHPTDRQLGSCFTLNDDHILIDFHSTASESSPAGDRRNVEYLTSVAAYGWHWPITKSWWLSNWILPDQCCEWRVAFSEKASQHSGYPTIHRPFWTSHYSCSAESLCLLPSLWWDEVMLSHHDGGCHLPYIVAGTLCGCQCNGYSIVASTKFAITWTNIPNFHHSVTCQNTSPHITQVPQLDPSFGRSSTQKSCVCLAKPMMGRTLQWIKRCFLVCSMIQKKD